MSLEVVRFLGNSPTPRRMPLSRFLSKWVIGGFVLAVIVLYILSIYTPSVSPLATSFLSSVDPLVSGLTNEISARQKSVGGEVNLFPVDPDSNMLVLFWTAFFGAPDARGAMGKQLFAGCPVSQCEATNDQGVADRSNAVVFHALDIDSSHLPGPRRPDQHYVFLLGESPANLAPHRIQNTPENFFDMTFTYKLDSDVLGHYAYSVPLQTEPTNFAAGKKKLVAWFVSNCHTHSKREDIAKELQKYIQVDVYGKCGPLKCPRSSEASCNAMLKSDYKFYLAFENSLCEDYVTEKFTNALSNFVVPIVLNGGNMTVFPPNSYINVEDYSSAEELAEYLKYLDKNNTAYNALMQWRYNSTLVSSSGRYSPARGSWCQLCEHLHDPGYRSTPYKDALRWFVDTGKCRNMQRPIFRFASRERGLRSA